MDIADPWSLNAPAPSDWVNDPTLIGGGYHALSDGR